MGYRTEERPAPKPTRTMQDTATPSRVFAHNGATVDLAIPCWYQEVHRPVKMVHHDRHLHDHLGWPDPLRPDRSCQLFEPFEAGHHPEPWHTAPGGHPPVRKLLDMSRLIPVHLLSEEEGYSTVDIVFLDRHEGIIAEGWIDPKEDWVVRVNFVVADPNATEFPQHYRFTVFVNADERTDEDGNVTDKKRHDIVCLSELVVLPSAYIGYEQEEDDGVSEPSA